MGVNGLRVGIIPPLPGEVAKYHQQTVVFRRCGESPLAVGLNDWSYISLSAGQCHSQPKANREAPGTATLQPKKINNQQSKTYSGEPFLSKASEG